MPEDKEFTPIEMYKQFHPLEMYGKKYVFAKRLKEGYTRVALGDGDWVDGNKIVAIWAFYDHDDSEGMIATYEHPKFTHEKDTIHGQPFEALYTKYQLGEYLKKFKIKLGKKMGLAAIVKEWEDIISFNL